MSNRCQNYILTFKKTVAIIIDISRNKRSLVNQASQWIQFASPIIFIDSFKRWFFSKTSSCKTEKEIYLNKGHFPFLTWISINGSGIVGNNITDLYNTHGRIHESQSHEQGEESLHCCYEEVLSVLWIGKLLSKKSIQNHNCQAYIRMYW